MTQNDAILSALQRGERLTPADALSKYGTFRLAARIWDLKQDGHAISERMVKVAGRDGTTCLVAEYSMETPGVLFDTKPAFRWEDA